MAGADGQAGSAVLGPGYALVVGGSPVRPSAALARSLAAEASLVVACDAGVEACEAAGVVPHLLVGDFDSADAGAIEWAVAAGAERIQFPVEKDDTDLGLAIEAARARLAPQGGAEASPTTRLVFTGVSGGRVDHALGALGRMTSARDLAPVIVEDGFVATLLAAGHATSWRAAPSDVGRTVSVVALEQDSEVSESGMHWGLEHRRLDLFDDLAISNVVESPDARVELHAGMALVVVNGKPRLS